LLLPTGWLPFITVLSFPETILLTTDAARDRIPLLVDVVASNKLAAEPLLVIGTSVTGLDVGRIWASCAGGDRDGDFDFLSRSTDGLVTFNDGVAGLDLDSVGLSRSSETDVNET
jgi:hypothetical protein